MFSYLIDTIFSLQLIAVPYWLIIGWIIFSIIYIIRFNKKGKTKINLYLYNSIPSVFTTLGVLGTFLGIFLGLQDFNVDNINASIPTLLEGMKMAFLTSIIGIILSVISRFFAQGYLKKIEKKEPPKKTDELSALNDIAKILEETKVETISNFKKLKEAMIGEADKSISTQIIKLKNLTTDNYLEQQKQNKLLTKIQSALIGTEDTSLLTQFEKLRSQITDRGKTQKEQLEKIQTSINSDEKNSLLTKLEQINTDQNNNNSSMRDKFDEFGELLKKNNTEALVEVMKSATETFNAQMSELIERLVQENFQELNNSVKKLNDWQHENKEMIATLTQQFTKVSNDFEISSKSIKEITISTKELTKDNSHLSVLIKELQKVLIDDKKFQQIVDKLMHTIDTLENNTDKFDETTNKLNNWIQKERNFRDAVDILISRLEEIERIKDINGEFWEKTKMQLNEGISIITKASDHLRNNLDDISGEFVELLNQTLTSLDELIQRLVEKYTK